MNYNILATTGFAYFDDEAVFKIGALNRNLGKVGIESQNEKDLMTDLVVLTATELELTHHEPVPDPYQLFPIQVKGHIFDMMILKTDTLPTLMCRTPQRVLQGSIDLADLFIFTADIDKLNKFFPNGISIPALQNDFNRIMESFLGRSTEVLFGDITNQFGIQLALKVESAIWRLRLSVLTHPGDENRNLEEFSEYGIHMQLPLSVPER